MLRSGRITTFLLVGLLSNIVSIVASPEPTLLLLDGRLRVSFSAAAATHGAAVLRIVVPELRATLAALPAGVFAEEASAVHFDLAPSWRAAPLGGGPGEACARSRAAVGGTLSVTCGGVLGLAYALHELREGLALALGGGGGGAGVGAAVAAFAAGGRAAPTFALRPWSEEGQLLALPDRGFYAADGSAADIAAIAGEAAALEAEVVPALLRLRMNALIVLHSDVEDYVTYDTLRSYLPGAPAIYPANATHRARRAGVVATMAPWIAHLAEDYGLAFFFQVYELSSPPGVCVPPAGGGAPLLNCSLRAPATAALLKAKYGELRAALPALAGVFVTVEDSWTPRAGYEFSVLWSGAAELPVAVTLFHSALVASAGLRMVFRLWLVGQPVSWPALRDGTPPDVEFSVKQTQGDFLLDFPLNALLSCAPPPADCPPRQRRMIVEVDAFRQYNGWTSGVCFMGEQWAPRLATAAANGAADVWGWGSWAPGCTWPDSGPDLRNATPGAYKSWRGWWNSYRLFNATPTNGGFSLGGQANAYLLSRLSRDAPPANATAIARDFGTLFFGAANAAPIAALLNASLHAWLPTSLPAGVGDFTLFWTMMQHDSGGAFSGLAKRFTGAQFRAAAAASAAAVADMAAALAAVDPAAVPASNPRGFEGAARAVGVTQGYLAAAFAWRTAGLLVAQLGAAPVAAACAEARGALADLAAAAAAFGAAFPAEAAAWVVASVDPALFSYPPFLSSLERTMAGFVPLWTAMVEATCKQTP